MKYQSAVIMFLIGITSCGSRAVTDASVDQPTRNYDSLLALQPLPRLERKLTTPTPSKEAVALYKYLQDVYGKKMLSGQMCVPWGYGELQYIEKETGKQPALRGIDFIHQRDNEAEVKNAIDWWNSGGIPT